MTASACQNPSGSATKAERSSRRRRPQIVEAAIEVLAHAEYAPASLEQIALRAGRSRGLTAYHFAGRDAE
ncbi:TetR family transcriptional regulator [bacterium]|nr:MAG: TetR family transcriptional regulator [bacterium]